MTPFQAHMKKNLTGMKGKSKAERQAIFKRAIASWKGGSRAGTSSSPRGAAPARKRRLSPKARAAAIKNLRRARHVQRKSSDRGRVHRGRVGRQSSRRGSMGFGRQSATVRDSLSLGTPGYFPGANPSSPRAHGDTNATPSPCLPNR